jgi:hypothetical protein
VAEIWDRIKDPESNFLERKPKMVNEDGYRKTLVAFANSVPEGQEAVLFVGVDDKGDVIGCDGTDGLQKKIRAFCEGGCYPPIKYSIDVRDFGGKSVLAVIVPHSHERPHFSGPAYVRVGSESKQATEEQYREFIAARSDVGSALLDFKYTGQQLTLVGLNKKLGADSAVQGRHRETAVCVIVSIDRHTVRFKQVDGDVYYNEALETLRLSRDEKRGLPMVIAEIR